KLFLCAIEIFEQLSVCSCLLERVEVHSMKVLQQRITEEIIIGCRTDDRRDRRLSGLLRSPEPPFTHDELVVTRHLGTPAYDYRLQNADLPDAGDELVERILIEDITRLPRVRTDQVEIDLPESGSRYGDELVDGIVLGRTVIGFTWNGEPGVPAIGRSGT